MIHDCDNQLEDSTGCEAGHEKDATTTIADYDEGVHHEGYESDSAEYATHREGVLNFGHGKEVRFVRWKLSVHHLPTHSLRFRREEYIPIINILPVAA